VKSKEVNIAENVEKSPKSPIETKEKINSSCSLSSTKEITDNSIKSIKSHDLTNGIAINSPVEITQKIDKSEDKIDLKNPYNFSFNQENECGEYDENEFRINLVKMYQSSERPKKDSDIAIRNLIEDIKQKEMEIYKLALNSFDTEDNKY